MSRVEIPRIVEILINDGMLITNWIQFSDKLLVPQSESFVWRGLFATGTITPYALFKNILMSWVGREKHLATLDLLNSKFIELQYKKIAGKKKDKILTLRADTVKLCYFTREFNRFDEKLAPPGDNHSSSE